MRICDPTANQLVPGAVCYTFGITEGIMLGVGLAVSAGTSIISGAQAASAAEAQAAMQEQQAQQAIQISQYNAEIQRQNAEVAYQMALYQSQVNVQMAHVSQTIALQNASFAQLQARGARAQYEQGLMNAEQQRIQAEASRAQGREEVNRQRIENDKKLAIIRAKYAASGVTAEGSALEILGDAAKFGELAVQDIAYTAELQSRKEHRQADIEKFKAGFSLLEEAGHNVEAANFRLEAQKFGYESQLYEYDSAIAGAKYRIGLNEARLVELSGQSQAWGFRAEAAQSRARASAAMMGGWLGAANAVGSTISTGYSWSQSNRLASGGGSLWSSSMSSAKRAYGSGYGAYGTNPTDYFGTSSSSYYQPTWA
jgi:hypothetical protein